MTRTAIVIPKELLEKLPSTTLSHLLLMAKVVDDEGRISCPQHKLCKLLDCSYPTMWKIVSTLRNLGLLATEHVPGSHEPTRYRLIGVEFVQQEVANAA